MRTANPALSPSVFTQSRSAVLHGEVMTIEGTVNKSMLAVVVTAAGAYTAWINPAVSQYILLSLIVAVAISLVIILKPATAPALTLVYAGAEGLVLGSISQRYQAAYPGIVVQAVTLTFGVLFCLLAAYRSGLIRPTEKFRLGIVAATGAVALLYLASMISGFFGVPFSFLQSSSMLSIGISCVIVVIAALNLVLDFDFIERGAASASAPKYMEWYGAFGLLVTLVWLYLEILRLLAKLQDRR